MAIGASLVSDDLIAVRSSGSQLLVSAPQGAASGIEARGNRHTGGRTGRLCRGPIDCLILLPKKSSGLPPRRTQEILGKPIDLIPWQRRSLTCPRQSACISYSDESPESATDTSNLLARSEPFVSIGRFRAGGTYGQDRDTDLIGILIVTNGNLGGELLAGVEQIPGQTASCSGHCGDGCRIRVAPATKSERR